MTWGKYPNCETKLNFFGVIMNEDFFAWGSAGVWTVWFVAGSRIRVVSTAHCGQTLLMLRDAE